DPILFHQDALPRARARDQPPPVSREIGRERGREVARLPYHRTRERDPDLLLRLQDDPESHQLRSVPRHEADDRETDLSLSRIPDALRLQEALPHVQRLPVT